MKKIITAIAFTSLLMVPKAMPASNKSPQEIGKIFGQIEACAIKGDINKIEKGIVKLKVADRYNLSSRTKWFKKQVTKGQFKEFERLGNGSPAWTKDIMCGVLRDKWL
ncbi:hypothetical protein [Photobacterium sanguinicancri]|uniref:Uncharacterized protein n=1 Tax=Photobacterium sanguinicancri TaxID=875932 RepID=A0ABX4FSG1_9GAMM|nr:hypothetical protein [Photobacterium sanguinicancri]OZS41808.1 hypothetical protein ASV53_21735 [Photobacterium sanguinicancri]